MTNILIFFVVVGLISNLVVPVQLVPGFAPVSVGTSKEDDLEDEGKTITIEELPIRSEEPQNAGAIEGNVTMKGVPKVNNSSNDSDLTTSSELTDQPQQETQTPSSKETTEDVAKKENKIKILEICNDKIDNDLNGIIDEEDKCISKPSDSRPNNEKVVPELATLNDNASDEEEEKKDYQKQNTQDKENDEEQSYEDSKLSKNKNVDNNVIEEGQRSLDPEIRPNGVEIITSEEICNDKIDNDLNGIIDEEDKCNNK